MSIILWIVLGGIAGWIASIAMQSHHSMLEDILLGVIGGFVGGLIMNALGTNGVSGFNLYSLLVAVVGAVVLIYLGRLLHS